MRTLAESIADYLKVHKFALDEVLIALQSGNTSLAFEVLMAQVKNLDNLILKLESDQE